MCDGRIRVTPVRTGMAFLLLCAACTATAQETERATLSGTVRHDGEALPGVCIQGLPGNPLTGDDGSYSSEIPKGWSGAIVPALWGYGFLPAVVAYKDLAGAQTQDFLAVPQVCVISGSITGDDGALPGVALQGLPGNPTTDENGAFASHASAGWSGIVTPSLEGYVFTPAAVTFQDLREDFNMAFVAGPPPAAGQDVSESTPQDATEITSEITSEITPEIAESPAEPGEQTAS